MNIRDGLLGLAGLTGIGDRLTLGERRSRRTRSAPRWMSDALYPSAVEIVTVSP